MFVMGNESARPTTLHADLRAGAVRAPSSAPNGRDRSLTPTTVRSRNRASAGAMTPSSPISSGVSARGVVRHQVTHTARYRKTLTRAAAPKPARERLLMLIPDWPSFLSTAFSLSPGNPRVSPTHLLPSAAAGSASSCSSAPSHCSFFFPYPSPLRASVVGDASKSRDPGLVTARHHRFVPPSQYSGLLPGDLVRRRSAAIGSPAPAGHCRLRNPVRVPGAAGGS